MPSQPHFPLPAAVPPDAVDAAAPAIVADMLQPLGVALGELKKMLPVPSAAADDARV
jgi:hypothetical protein